MKRIFDLMTRITIITIMVIFYISLMTGILQIILNPLASIFAAIFILVAFIEYLTYKE